MATLMRMNPFREMFNIRREFDNLFNEAFNPSTWPSQFARSDWGIALDLTENDDAFVVKAAVPGLSPNDVDMTISDNVLTIKGEFREDEEVDEEQYHMRERYYGAFSRSLSLPGTVDADNIEATYHNGILTITLPKTEEAKPRRIAIQSGESKTKVIEGSTA